MKIPKGAGPGLKEAGLDAISRVESIMQNRLSYKRFCIVPFSHFHATLRFLIAFSFRFSSFLLYGDSTVISSTSLPKQH